MNIDYLKPSAVFRREQLTPEQRQKRRRANVLAVSLTILAVAVLVALQLFQVVIVITPR